MKCHMCGGKMSSAITDLPFKVGDKTIVIVKELPMFQCDTCSEYLLDDPVMKRVEEMVKHVDGAAELEVIRYAA